VRYYLEVDFEKAVEKYDKSWEKVQTLEEANVAFLRRPAEFQGVSVLLKDEGVEFYLAGRKVGEIGLLDEDIVVPLALMLAGKKVIPLDWARRMVSGLLQGMIVLMETESEDSTSHSQRVARLSEKVGEALGFSREELLKLRECAMLHDVGKIGIEQLMLFTPTRIRIFEQYPQDHTIMGSVFLASLELLWDVVPVVRHHHERWDGNGYPDGLRGEEIPLFARIIAVCDYYDELTHFVSSEWESTVKTHEEAIEMIKRESGRRFDPTVVEAFLKVFSDKSVQEHAE